MTRFGLGVRDPVANYLCIYCAPYLHQNKDWPRIYWHRISIKTKTGLGARDPIANLPVYLLAPYLHQNKDWPCGYPIATGDLPRDPGEFVLLKFRMLARFSFSFFFSFFLSFFYLFPFVCILIYIILRLHSTGDMTRNNSGT